MGNSGEIKIFDTKTEVFKAIAEGVLSLTQISTQAVFNIALSGGNSPKGLFEKISKEYASRIPWGRIHLWWGDERCVPPDNKESNYKMTVDYLLANIDIPDENIHRIYGEDNPEGEAERYSQELEGALILRNGIPVFDIIILGLGDDGHTASIFPDQIGLFEYDRNCAVAMHPVTEQKRITLAGKVLNNASQIYFLVTGKNKSERVEEIINDHDVAKLLPAYYISPRNGKFTWFLDKEAASLIS